MRLFEPTTSADRPFATLPDVSWPAAGRTAGGVVIAPNGRTLFYNRLNSREADLMLIEHFR